MRAVVHHGGCSTNGIGLRAGKSTLVMPLALDQMFYGRRVHELDCGPEPLYVRFEIPSVERIEESIRELISGRYDPSYEFLLPDIPNLEQQNISNLERVRQ